jgi:hypothetical protein
MLFRFVCGGDKFDEDVDWIGGPGLNLMTESFVILSLDQFDVGKNIMEEGGFICE